MIAVDYIFYSQTFKGKTSEADFGRLSIKATAYLDRVTFDRITDDLTDTTATKAKLAFCEVIDTLLLNEQGGGVTAESNDGVSVTYVASKTARTDTQRLRDAVGLYLSGTDLLYRGVD